MVEGIFCGVLGQEGKAALRLRGRGHGPRMVWKCALGAPGCPEAFSTKVSRSWAKLGVGAAPFGRQELYWARHGVGASIG